MNARLVLLVFFVLATLTPASAADLLTDPATAGLWERTATNAAWSLTFALGGLLISGILGAALGLVLLTLEGGLDAGAHPCDPGLGDKLGRLTGKSLHALLDLVALMPALVLGILVAFFGRSLLEPGARALLILSAVCLPTLSLRAYVAARDAAHLPHLRVARLRGEGAARRLCVGLLPHAWPAFFAALVSRCGPLLALGASLSFFGLADDRSDLGVAVRQALCAGLELESDADWLQCMEASGRFAEWVGAQWQELLVPLLLLWALVAVFAAWGWYLRRGAQMQ